MGPIVSWSVFLSIRAQAISAAAVVKVISVTVASIPDRLFVNLLEYAMRLLISALFLSILFGFTPAVAEQIRGSSFGFGNWNGAAYTSDATGEFSHCVISADYVSGDTLFFSVNSDASVSVAVSSPNLNLLEGQQFPVALYIDRRAPFYGTATAISAEAAVLHITEFERALRDLRKGYVLRVESPAGAGVYNLTGTYRALEATTACAVRYLDYADAGTQPAQEDTFDRTVLFQIATEMIAEMGITEFRYFNEAETRDLFVANAVLWSSETSGVLGGVTIVPADGITSLRDGDGGDIAFLTKDCDGEVATTARNISMEALEARELRSLCVTDDSQVESLLTKTLVGDHVLYTFLAFGGDAAGYAEEARPKLSEGVALRAASYVKEAVDLK